MKISRILKLLHSTMVALVAFVPCALQAGAQTPEAGPALIPQPKSVEMHAGSVLVDDGTSLIVPPGDEGAAFAAQHLAGLAAQAPGIHLRSAKSVRSQAAVIHLIRDNSIMSSEAYVLTVTPKGMMIRASGDAGLYYGTITLWQLLTLQADHRGPVRLRSMEIHDEPQMRWRGIMVDSVRHMQSIAFLHSLLDWMSLVKLNTLHWHLTDDQGWRVEIKRYPKLTSIGAWRPAAGTTTLGGAPYGGFYSQAQVRELVHFAGKRGITIVPEIEMPGHATAAIASYPELGSSKDAPQSPTNHYGILPSIFNPSPQTFAFLENVLDEVMALFPSSYIHVGGDEALKDEWEASPIIKEQMAARGLHTEEEWQSYFVSQIGSYLAAHGRRMIGWDEILNGRVPDNAVVMSWHGVQGAVEAARKQHDAVLTPVRPMYFDFRQSLAPDEHPGWATENKLASVYHFDPLPSTLTEGERAHILGVQANVWTEYLITDDRVAWMIFPRAAALAEVGWSPEDRHDWQSFCRRLPVEFARYRDLGVPFDPAAYRVAVTAASTATLDQAKVTLSKQLATGTIRFTKDGSGVTAQSETFESTLAVSLPVRIHAATFVGGRQVIGSEISESITASSLRHAVSQQLTPCSPDPVVGMEHDPVVPGRPVMMVNYQDPCWIEKSARLDGMSNIMLQVQAFPWSFDDGSHKKPTLKTSVYPSGELDVHLDRCDGLELASIQLPEGKRAPAAATLHASIAPISGTHDVCFLVRRPKFDPLWSIDWLQWNPSQEAKEDAVRQ